MENAVDKRIVVLLGSWVFIGEYHPAQDTVPAYLINASCIRSWGTTAGLGEIALSGPTETTKMDPCGTVILEPNAVLFSLRCTR